MSGLAAKNGRTPAAPRGAIPSLIKRNTLYFALAQAMQGAGMQMAITMSALMVVRLLGSSALAGLGGAFLGLSRLVAAYPSGKLTDAYGRRFGMIAGLTVGLIGSLVLAAALPLSSFAVFIVGMMLLGLGVGAVSQLRVAAADMYPPARRAEGLGYVLTGSVAGAVIGPLIISIAGVLSDRTGLDSINVSWLLVPIAILPAIFLITRVRPDPKTIASNLGEYWPGYEAPAPRGIGSAATSSSFMTFIRHRPKQVAYLCYATAQGTMSMMMVMTPLVMSDSGYSLTPISIAVSLHVAGMFAFSVPLGRLSDRVGRKPLLLVGLLVEAVGAILVPVTDSFWIITAGLFLVGVGWSSVNVSSTALLADTTDAHDRGRAIGAADTFSSSLAFGMPLLGGLLADVAGLMTVGIVGAIVVTVPILALTRLRESSPGQYEPAETPVPVASARTSG
ncbi:MAG: MFS transporter [Chloroflexi bacterium]|nr:MFS transporter [Chloroflexota bacterium]